MFSFIELRVRCIYIPWGVGLYYLSITILQKYIVGSIVKNSLSNFY